LGFPQDGFSQILRPLLKHCVNTERDPDDGRNRRLTITEAGRTTLATIVEEYETVIADRFSGLQHRQRSACVRALERIATPTSQLLTRKPT
jgi:DNA-binding MarR family transcriptional regulator